MAIRDGGRNSENELDMPSTVEIGVGMAMQDRGRGIDVRQEKVAQAFHTSSQSRDDMAIPSSLVARPLDEQLKSVLFEFERKRVANGLSGKSWQVMTYGGFLRIVRYTYQRKSAAVSQEIEANAIFLYQVRYSLNGVPSTVNLGRSDQVLFDDAVKRAQEFHAKVSKERSALQQRKPLLAHKKSNREKTAHTFKSVDDALFFLKTQWQSGISYFSVYWQLAILLPILGSHIDRLRWEDFDLDKNLLKLRNQIVDSNKVELTISINQDISNLMRSWKDYDYRLPTEFVFVDIREKSRSPRRLVHLDEELNSSWRLYRLNPHELGVFWKRELINNAHLSKDYLDKVFGTPICGKLESQEDRFFLDYLLNKWWDVIDVSGIYPVNIPFPKQRRTSHSEQAIKSAVGVGGPTQYRGMEINNKFSLKDFADNPLNANYSIEGVDYILETSNLEPFISGETRSYKNRIWRSTGKLPVYFHDEFPYPVSADLIGLVLASDLADPRFLVDGLPGIFLVSPVLISNPENLVHSGYDIEIGDDIEYKSPISKQPDSLFKKIPLRIIPFVSGALLRASITGVKYLYRISKTGDPTIRFIPISEVVGPSVKN